MPASPSLPPKKPPTKPPMERQPFKVAEPLPIYVIYHFDPAFPDRFVVRRLTATPDPEPLAVETGLAAARAAIVAVAPEAQRFEPGPHDDPNIEELWQ